MAGKNKITEKKLFLTKIELSHERLVSFNVISYIQFKIDYKETRMMSFSLGSFLLITFPNEVISTNQTYAIKCSNLIFLKVTECHSKDSEHYPLGKYICSKAVVVVHFR